MAQRTNGAAPAAATPATPRMGPAAVQPSALAVLAAGMAQRPAAPAPAATITRRNSTPSTATLVATNKVPKCRAAHVQQAWAAVLAALPCNAAHLCTLPQLAVPACVSPQAFVSYMQRRGHLAPKQG